MRVGFIGLGDIGMPMARRLVDEGLDVVALDKDADKTASLAEAGAESADDLRGLDGCEVICVAVPDDDTVVDILSGDGDLLSSLEKGSVVLIHSTILPATAKRLAADGEAAGVVVVDAPVSGGAARARTGELVVMAGADADYAAAAPVLDALASTTVAAGPAGAGAAVKLANQLAMLASLAALQEGLELAARFGVQQETVFETLQLGTGDSWVLRNWGFFDDLARSYDKAGVDVFYRPWSKDIWDVVAAGREARVAVPLAGLLSQYLAEAVEKHAKEGSR